MNLSQYTELAGQVGTMMFVFIGMAIGLGSALVLLTRLIHHWAQQLKLLRGHKCPHGAPPPACLSGKIPEPHQWTDPTSDVLHRKAP